MKQPDSIARKVAISGIFMASYIALMFFTQSFSFGQYQIRIATSLYALSSLFPFLILPSGLANALSNTLMGGLGIADIIGGLVVGLLTSSSIVLIRKLNLPRFLIIFPIIFIPGLGVPLYLHILLDLPYWVLATSVIIGQIIPAFIGYLLVITLEKRLSRS